MPSFNLNENAPHFSMNILDKHQNYVEVLVNA